MARKIATSTDVDRDGLLDFVRPRHRMILSTYRRDGGLQSSPVTGGVDGAGRLVVATYPERAKTRNALRDPRASVVVLSDDFDGPWVQLYGEAAVVDGDAGVERLVDYYRAAAGEHPDWDEYRDAMRDRSKVAIDIEVTDWGPIATGGVPPEFA